jgi:Mg2+ and Co2+ transporter CorA
VHYFLTPQLVVLQVILSLVATVFLPLTFITGVFGMNFQLHAE